MQSGRGLKKSNYTESTPPFSKDRGVTAHPLDLACTVSCISWLAKLLLLIYYYQLLSWNHELNYPKERGNQHSHRVISPSPEHCITPLQTAGLAHELFAVLGNRDSVQNKLSVDPA